MTAAMTIQDFTTTATTIDEDEEDAENSTDAQSEKDNTPRHLFGTVCPKEEISVSGHRLVHGHLDKHSQLDDRSREF